MKPWSASAASTASKTRSLARGRPALRGQPERQLAEPDLAHDVVGEVLPEQGDPLRLEAPSAVGYSGSLPLTRPPGWPRARRAARRRARRAPAAAARSRRGSRRTGSGAASSARARSPSPTSTTGSSPNRSAIAKPPSMVLIGPHGTPAVDEQLEPLDARRGSRSRSTRSGPQLVAVGRCGRRCARSAGRRRPRGCRAPRRACGTGRRWPR